MVSLSKNKAIFQLPVAILAAILDLDNRFLYQMKARCHSNKKSWLFVHVYVTVITLYDIETSGYVHAKTAAILDDILAGGYTATSFFLRTTKNC